LYVIVIQVAQFLIYQMPKSLGAIVNFGRFHSPKKHRMVTFD